MLCACWSGRKKALLVHVGNNEGKTDAEDTGRTSRSLSKSSSLSAFPACSPALAGQRQDLFFLEMLLVHMQTAFNAHALPNLSRYILSVLETRA